MRILRALLVGLAPALAYLGTAELCCFVWAHDLKNSFGLAGLFGGAALGLLTMPAWSLGNPAFREFFFEQFGGGGSGIQHRALVDAQADIWLLTLWIYSAAVVVSFLFLLLKAQSGKPKRP